MMYLHGRSFTTPLCYSLIGYEGFYSACVLSIEYSTFGDPMFDMFKFQMINSCNCLMILGKQGLQSNLDVELLLLVYAIEGLQSNAFYHMLFLFSISYPLVP